MNSHPHLRISAADRVFILTGAGVSAESGIPTFRDNGGLWRQYRFEEVASPVAWRRDPQMVWEFYSMRRRVAAAAKPNPAHLAIARLEQALPQRVFLCTQNVDDLHEKGGAEQVHHMHGELFRSRCDTCDRESFPDTNTYEPPQPVPRCPCGGQIRPHICWFGEVPYDLDIPFSALQKCSIFLAIGTSGVVEPASSFARYARDLHARTIYVGPEDPANAYFFSETYLGKAGELLPELLRVE